MNLHHEYRIIHEGGDTVYHGKDCIHIPHLFQKHVKYDIVSTGINRLLHGKDKPMSYRAIDVARFIVNYSNDMKYGITHLKLQKMLYFEQGYFFMDKGTECFSDDMEAWGLGPVVREVWEEFKSNGSANIQKINSILIYDDPNDIWSINRVPYINRIRDKKDQKRISDVVDIFKDYSASRMVDLTHNQRPWKSVYVPHKNNIIPKQVIKEYFTDGKESA